MVDLLSAVQCNGSQLKVLVRNNSRSLLKQLHNSYLKINKCLIRKSNDVPLQYKKQQICQI